MEFSEAKDPALRAAALRKRAADAKMRRAIRDAFARHRPGPPPAPPVAPPHLRIVGENER